MVRGFRHQTDQDQEREKVGDPLVTLSDMRALKYCNRGARLWCARYGLDWDHFRKHGLPASVIEATGNAMAIRLCNEVRRGR